MKKFLFIISVTLLFFTSRITIFASEVADEQDETNSVELEVKAGIKADSPFYFLDKSFEKIRLWASREEVKDAKLRLEIAEERLAELNALDDDQIDEYADQLYEEYGLNLEKVNEYVSKTVVEDQLSEKALTDLTKKLDHAAMVDQAVSKDKMDNISIEIKDKIKESQTKAYAVHVVLGIEKTQLSELKDQGYGYGEIIKLQAILAMSQMSMDDIVYLDVFNENNGEKEIDFGKLADELGLDKTQIQNQFKDYKDAIKNEQTSKKNDIKRQMNEQLSKVVENHRDQFLNKIEELYQARLETIQNSSLTDNQKEQLSNQLTNVKQDLVRNIESKVREGNLNPQDIGDLNREIVNQFNMLLDELDIDADEIDEIKENINRIESQIKPAVTSIVNQFEQKTNIDVTEQQLNIIIGEILEEAKDNFNRGKGNQYLNVLQKVVEERLNELFEDELEQFNEKINNNNSSRNNDRDYKLKPDDLNNSNKSQGKGNNR